MPSIPGIPGPYRFFFYSFDCNESAHVHVQRDTAVCKFWLHRVELASTQGFSPRELARIRRIIFEERHRIAEAWREHCDKKK
ncbi:MAG: DUF4160 domain-containing protein [Gemmatimonadaceae bacterium]